MMPVVESSLAKSRKELALLPGRMAIGATMLVHGTAKLSAEGAEQHGQMFDQMGLKPGKPLAVATGLAEAFAGVSALLGLWTRPAALAVLITQGVAIAKVHASKGFNIMKGGYEYNLAL